MDNIFIIAGIVSIVFFLAKFVEMRFIEKESKPLKLLVRDTLIVYVSVVLGHFVLGQLKPIMQQAGDSGPIVPSAFTDNPTF